MTEKKKRKTKAETKLQKSVNTLASIIETKAESMLENLKNGGKSDDIKQIKELTGAVKELSALVYQNRVDGKEESSAIFTVVFDGEGEEWAK